MVRARLMYVLAFILVGILPLVGCGCSRVSVERPTRVGATVAPTGVGLLTTTSVPVTVPAEARRVLFLDQDALYIMNADGSGKTKLGDGVKQYHLSPDWTTVALVVARGEPAKPSYDLHTIKVDGTERAPIGENINVKRPQVISPVEGSVDWSPDSTRLAFAIRDGGVHIVDPDGRNRVQLAGCERNAVWSPDGERIACTQDRDLWIVDGEGVNSRRLVRSIAHDYVPTPKGVWVEEWSPDGQWILYSDFDPPLANTVWYHIINAEGGEPMRVAGFPIYWSPDGKKIALRDGEGVLWISRSDGSSLIKVAESVSRTYDRVGWSPDGAWIAWVTEGEDRAAEDVFVSRVDGGTRVKVNSARLTFSPELEWSPEGQYLVYWEPGKGIYLARADGRLNTKLHDTGDCPFWSRDGEVLTFGAQDGFYLAAAGRQWDPILVHGDWSLGYSDCQWIAGE